jgi:hypothetical protein
MIILKTLTEPVIVQLGDGASLKLRRLDAFDLALARADAQRAIRDLAESEDALARYGMGADTFDTTWKASRASA